MASGQVVANATAPTPVTSFVLPVKATLLIKNLKANTDNIYVGTSINVTATNGFELAGDEAILLSASACYGYANNIYVIAGSNTPTFCWLTEIDGQEFTDKSGQSFDFTQSLSSDYILLI